MPRRARTTLTAAACAAVCAAASACGGGSGSSAGAAGPTTAAPALPASSAPAAPSAQPSTPPTTVAVPAAISTEPKVSVPPGAPPKQLVVKDLVVGTGAVAHAGDNLVVQYVGVNFADGKVFDASWTDGPNHTPQSFPFQLGAGQVIAGWEQGLAGMRVGGRRELIIPPALGYGDQGQPPITPNETLVFVVDLLSAG